MNDIIIRKQIYSFKIIYLNNNEIFLRYLYLDFLKQKYYGNYLINLIINDLLILINHINTVYKLNIDNYQLIYFDYNFAIKNNFFKLKKNN